MSTQPTTSPATRGLAPFLALAVLAVGCGGPVPTPADQDKARQTLDAALNGWKEGRTVDAMKEGSPSIVVADPKWERGAKLSRYTVEGEGQPSGSERAFNVTLWLADARGKEAREQVVYKVGTDPIFTVFRSLF